MNDPIIEARALARSGMDLLRSGDARGARAAFERVVASGEADASLFVVLAHACRGLGDAIAEAAAFDRALALESRNVLALVGKGDCLARSGDERAAIAFYLEGMKAAPTPEQLTPELRAELDRVKAICERAGGKLEAQLQVRLAAEGLTDRPTTGRFRHSLELLFGRKAVYFQEPRFYYFPELPQVQFYDRSAFPWLGDVEAATAEIREELLGVMQEPSAFRPYVASDPTRPTKSQQGMLDNPDWSAFYLWKDGELVAGNAARCPKTMAVLERVPLPRMRGRSPVALFSLLRPGARIPPHNGFINTRLICHLPLLVPDGCSFRVGNDTRVWEEGKAWAFDDTIEHEAWNNSDRIRVILLFEVWRPELTDEERKYVTAMFEEIAAAGGLPKWED
jgi:aspartyl/asparaginyl beta-hydroxylase (cupin superfamily)